VGCRPLLLRASKRKLAVYLSPLLVCLTFLDMEVANTSSCNEATPGGSSPGKGKLRGMGTLFVRGAGHLSGNDVPLSELVDYFARQLDRPLVDETDLAGQYDFTLRWTPDAPSGSPGPSLSSALEQQLGGHAWPRP
jgi:uncharacterized protein (TIGR03435 family)